MPPHAGAEGEARQAVAGIGDRGDARRRADHGEAHARAGQRRTDRRPEGHRRERLVRGTAVGTENIYKIYAESFRDERHLQAIVAEAQQIVDDALSR